MHLYRIAPEIYLEDYSGQGASFRDGARWNRPGQPVLYFAKSPAIAMLEMGHYLPSPWLVPKSYRLGIYNLPDHVATDTLADALLPGDWAQFPYPAKTQSLGGDWLEAGNALVLWVPSSAVPKGLEKLAVVNPRHAQIGELKLVETITDIYNQRLFTGIKNSNL